MKLSAKQIYTKPSNTPFSLFIMQEQNTDPVYVFLLQKFVWLACLLFFQKLPNTKQRVFRSGT